MEKICVVRMNSKLKLSYDCVHDCFNLLSGDTFEGPCSLHECPMKCTFSINITFKDAKDIFAAISARSELRRIGAGRDV